MSWCVLDFVTTRADNANSIDALDDGQTCVWQVVRRSYDAGFLVD